MQAAAAKLALARALAKCPTAEFQLVDGLTTISAPRRSDCQDYPPGGPLYLFEMVNVDVCLTVAVESPRSRHDWIQHIKARLRPKSYVDTLRWLYMNKS